MQRFRQPKFTAMAPGKINVLNRKLAAEPLANGKAPAKGITVLHKKADPNATPNTTPPKPPPAAPKKSAAADIGKRVEAQGALALKADGLLDSLKAAAEDTASPVAREGALRALTAVAEKAGRACEAYLVPLLPMILERFADKVPSVRTAAESAGRAIMAALCPHAVALVLPILLDGMETQKNWQVQRGSLVLLNALTKTAPKQIATSLPLLVPRVSERMCDAKEQVKTAAMMAMTKACNVVGNRDVEGFTPTLISFMARPSEACDAIIKLSATTFVQAIEAPVLSILVPLLVRGLRERNTAIIRKTAIIIENMAKLVYNPADASVFVPRLLPGLDKAQQETANPECRSVVSRAHDSLLKITGGVVEDEAQISAKAAKKAAHDQGNLEAANVILTEVVSASSAGVQIDAFATMALQYISAVAAQLIAAENYDPEEWQQSIKPYLTSFLGDQAAEVCKAFLAKCDQRAHQLEDSDEDDADGEKLCNCEFSLAYGGKILLSSARLKLRRGRRYGLCGANGVGKSTLMRAIAKGQLDGFPPKDVLRTVYVEHDIDASMSEMAIIDYIFEDPVLQGLSHPPRELVAETLRSVGFSDAMQQTPIASLSGGWRMKLAIARAMLMKADIMLLDEPTNHLDIKNVAWLESYLTSLPNVTSIVVSHDSGFLDNVCTDILHYESKKLKLYRGNLSEFVKVKPEAQSYYDLEAAQLAFEFPKPGVLEGIKTRDRAIIKMSGVGFQYPGSDRKQLTDIHIQCSLSSRVAVLGVNGAGKSTLIKLLTSELEAQEGTVWKHPNLRVAYVAQHAFHHVEQHLDSSPLQYLQWRYETGEDREGLSKVSRTLTEEDKAALTKTITIDGKARIVECLKGRRKFKKTFEYEVKWLDTHEKHNTWMPAEQLQELGFGKLVADMDFSEAERLGLLGLDSKPLNSTTIREHLRNFGLEDEFNTHSVIRGLSGGQKVKVVLAAAMWNNPHMLVLDEPTNFLDRESLGALANAIKAWEGSVVMISHNNEFTSALCNETWTVADGRLTIRSMSDSSMEAAVGMKKSASGRELSLDEVEEKARARAQRREKTALRKERMEKLKQDRYAKKF
ncbi:hypothetical protein WJX72_007361 [[Myrmecia] bisecta]|uniref:Elongation factor 3 n=1 Tax=[Myrmecia] bisecta TaxID=41462 RepID=A0AAW1R7R4_9CHLO